MLACPFFQVSYLLIKEGKGRPRFSLPLPSPLELFLVGTIFLALDTRNLRSYVTLSSTT